MLLRFTRRPDTSGGRICVRVLTDVGVVIILLCLFPNNLVLNTVTIRRGRLLRLFASETHIVVLQTLDLCNNTFEL